MPPRPTASPSPVSGARAPLAFAALIALHLTACNAIFGVRPGENETSGTGASASTSTATTGTGASTNTGGSTSSGAGGSTSSGTGATSSTGGSGCSPYDGDGSVSWSDLGGASVPAVQFSVEGSVRVFYVPATDKTELSTAGYPASGLCLGGTEITLSGPPIEGQVYTVVDRATAANYPAFHATPSAFVVAWAREEPETGDCSMGEEIWHGFDSVADLGEVKVTSLDGTHLAIEASGIVTAPNPDPMYVGMGSIGVSLNATANCYYIEE